MLAYLGNIGYFLVVERAKDELKTLLYDNLEAPLVRMGDEQEDLGKKVILGLGDNESPTGIEVTFAPEDDYEECSEVRVAVNSAVWLQLEEGRRDIYSDYGGEDKRITLSHKKFAA